MCVHDMHNRFLWRYLFLLLFKYICFYFLHTPVWHDKYSQFHYAIFTTHAILYVVAFVLKAVVTTTCILQVSLLTWGQTLAVRRSHSACLTTGRSSPVTPSSQAASHRASSPSQGNARVSPRMSRLLTSSSTRCKPWRPHRPCRTHPVYNYTAAVLMPEGRILQTPCGAAPRGRPAFVCCNIAFSLNFVGTR